MSASPEGRSYLPPEELLDRNSKLAYASLAMGFTCWILLPILAAIPAIILGHMARVEIAKSEGRITGDGFAVAGLVMGYANLVILSLIVACIASLFLLPGIGKILTP
jgi:predicted anti-sigma-YlaC factor YlaD